MHSKFAATLCLLFAFSTQSRAFANDAPSPQPQALRQPLNPKEAALVAKYPVEALKVYKTMKRALDLTSENFPQSSAYNDGADAFKHFVWSGLTTQAIGVAKAKEFLDAHEDFAENPAGEKAMDLHNNQEGREAALQLRNVANFEAAIVNAAQLALSQGRLIISP